MFKIKGLLRQAFFILPLDISKNMVYNTHAPAGVMGSDGSAACGGRSNLSDGQRSIADEGFYKPRKISGTATGQSPTECEQENFLPV